MKLIFIVILLLSHLSALAERVDFNKILASVSAESWTTRDQLVFESVLHEVFKRKKLSDYSSTNLNDFLLSRVSQKEAKLFQLTTEKIVVTDLQRKKLSLFSASEVDREVDLIAKSLAVLELKESQHKDATRFNNWFELMKRKYVVKIKTTDFK